MTATKQKPRPSTKSAKAPAAKKEGETNGQAPPTLNADARTFAEKASGKDGVALKDRVLIAIKDGAEHIASTVFPRLEDHIPAELVVDDPDAAEAGVLKAGRGAMLAAALKVLEEEKRITVKGLTDGAWNDDAKIQLVRPKRDDRFEIDPTFQHLLPPQSESELAALEHQILTEGCRKALTIWEHGNRSFLVNGHTRLTICQRHGLEFELDQTEQPDREAVINWIWTEHLGQRNFNPFAERYARGRRFAALKLSHGGVRRGEGSKSQTETLKPAKGVAESCGVGRATLFRDGEFTEALDRLAHESGRNEIRTQVLSRKVRLSVRQVVDLAAKTPDQIKAAVGKFLDQGTASVKTKAKKAKKAKFIQVPTGTAKEKEQAAILFGEMGAEKVAKLIAELTKLVEAK